jgi:hypothetical protein
VQTGRRKKKCRGWVEPVAGRGWKRREGLAVTRNAVKVRLWVETPWVETKEEEERVWPCNDLDFKTLIEIILNRLK